MKVCLHQHELGLVLRAIISYFHQQAAPLLQEEGEEDAHGEGCPAASSQQRPLNILHDSAECAPPCDERQAGC